MLRMRENTETDGARNLPPFAGCTSPERSATGYPTAGLLPTGHLSAVSGSRGRGCGAASGRRTYAFQAQPASCAGWYRVARIGQFESNTECPAAGIENAVDHCDPRAVRATTDRGLHISCEPDLDLTPGVGRKQCFHMQHVDLGEFANGPSPDAGLGQFASIEEPLDDNSEGHSRKAISATDQMRLRLQRGHRTPMPVRDQQ